MFIAPVMHPIIHITWEHPVLCFWEPLIMGLTKAQIIVTLSMWLHLSDLKCVFIVVCEFVEYWKNILKTSTRSCIWAIAHVWLYVRGSPCVVRLIRLCIKDTCWMAVMIYASRMDSELRGNIHLTIELLSKTHRREAFTHSSPGMHTQTHIHCG